MLPSAGRQADEAMQHVGAVVVVPGNFSPGIDSRRDRQFGSRCVEGRDRAIPVTHKAMVSICGIDPISGDLSFVVDARGRGIHCTGEREYTEIPIPVPYKALSNFREPAGPNAHDLPLVVDAPSVCDLRTWHIEGSNRTVVASHKTMEEN